MLGSGYKVICIFFCNDTDVTVDGTAVYTNPGNSVTAPETTPKAPVENAGFTGWVNDDTRAKFDETTKFDKATDFVACFQFNAPAPGEGFTVDYADETVTPDEGFVVSFNESGGDAGGDKMSIEPGATIYVFRPEDKNIGIAASDATKNTLPASPPVPEVEGGAGRITGADAAMEDDFVKSTLIMQGGYKVLTEDDVRAIFRAGL